MRDGAHDRYSIDRKLPFLAGEVGDEVCAGSVVLADIVVVDGLLEETPLGDRCVNGRGRSVGEAEKWLSVDLAQDSAVRLDARVRPDHLQIEHEPAGLD